MATKKIEEILQDAAMESWRRYPPNTVVVTQKLDDLRNYPAGPGQDELEDVLKRMNTGHPGSSRTGPLDDDDETVVDDLARIANNQGRAAFLAGILSSMNPYKESPEFGEWDNGWSYQKSLIDRDKRRN